MVKIPAKYTSRKFQLTVAGFLALVVKCIEQGHVSGDDLLAGVGLITGYNVSNAIAK